MYKKILLAYDGTEEGRVALLECADIAQLLQAETHLLAIMRMPFGIFLAEGFVPDTVMEEERRQIQSSIDDGVALLRKGGHSAHGHLAYGDPVEEICRLAAELGVDLIVLGHRKQASFASRWWKSSLGASLLERAPCSILVVVGC